MAAHFTNRGGDAANAETFTLSAAAAAGDIISAPSGRLGVVQGLRDLASGDEVTVRFDLQGDFKAKSTDTFAAAADGYWDATNKEITSTASGNTKLISVTVAKTSGQTTVAGVMRPQKALT